MATALGGISLATTDDEEFLVPVYYSMDTTGTITSPDHVCTMLNGKFTKFEVSSNITTCTGTLKFIDYNNRKQTLLLHRDNGLWYLVDIYYYSPHVSGQCKKVLNKQAEMELWSLRLGCPGETELSDIT